MAKKTNLGRGLDALFGEEEPDYGDLDKVRQARALPVELLDPSPYQPRRRFDEAELEALVKSVREQGILQPILVRPNPNDEGRYQIIAGERRWRAAQRAQLHEVPVVVREFSDLEALQIAIIENVQRQDLTPLEEAEGYRRLLDEFDYTQEDVARSVGRSRSHITNTMRLLDLPASVQELLQDGKLTAGHARALLACEDAEAAAETVIKRGLNVRQTEALARGGADPKSRARKGSGGPAASAGGVAPRAFGGKDPDTLALEEELAGLLGLRVAIDSGADQSGTMTIHFQTLEQLDDVLHRLTHGPHGAE